MNKGEEKKIHEILESGSIGYAYLFDAKARKTLEKVVSLEPENLAALFRKYGTEMEWMSVTDMRDRMVLRAASGKISSCKDEESSRGCFWRCEYNHSDKLGEFGIRSKEKSG